MQVKDVTVNSVKKVAPTGKGWIGNSITGYNKTPVNGIMFQLGDPIYLNFMDTFIGFVGGARGSGKSYATNVIVEELLKNNPTLGLIAIDKPGLYFSLKYPNTHTEEFRGWGDKVAPRSYADRVRVLVPVGWKQYYPDGAYDDVIGIRPSQLTSQNWFDCLRIEATKPQGIVLSIFLKKIAKVNPNWTIEQLVKLVNRVVEVEANPDEVQDDIAIDVLNEIEFKTTTIEALQSKLMASSTWGIFSSKAMDIFDLCKAGVLTIIDISWWQIPIEVGALLVAFLTEQLFGIRMMKSQEKMHKAIGEEIKYIKSDKELPPPVLIIEEAQNYLASKTSENTFSVRALQRYVRQGRQASCSLVCITQQPGAIDTGPLSQVDWVIQFSLTHEADFQAIKNILPCELPKNWKSDLRGLQIGEAIMAFRKDAHYRKMKIRPRETIHLAETKTTDMFQLRSEYAKTEVEQLQPIEPPIVAEPRDVNEIQRLLKENLALRHQFEAMRSEKNNAISELNDQIAQKNDELASLSTKTTDLQKIVTTERVAERHGIIICKFDETHGHVPDYETSSGQVDDKLLRDIVRSSIGFGETLASLNFKLNREIDYLCFSKRFSRKEEDARGGETLYALVVFTTDKSSTYDEPLLDRIIKELLADWKTRTKTIDKYFSQLFYSVQDLRQAVDFYRLQLNDAQRRIRLLVQKRQNVIDLLKERVVKMEEEKHLLAAQIDNMGNIFNLEKPEVRAILMEDKFEEIKRLSQELENVKASLDTEKKVHTEELERSKQVILKLDREIEQAEDRVEKQIYGDLQIEDRLQRLKGSKDPQTQSQLQAVEEKEGDLVAYVDRTGLRPLLDQIFQEEREKHIAEIQDLEGAITSYKKGLVEIRESIKEMRKRDQTKVLQTEEQAIRTLKFAKELEKEIASLKITIRELRPKPAETIPEKERTHIFSDQIVPTEVARALNQDSYPEQIENIAQGIKKKVVGLEPLAFKILTVLETVDTWVTLKNLELIVLNRKGDAIHKRLQQMIKDKLVIQRNEGNKFLYHTNLKRLVQETFNPYRAVLTGVQIDSIYMDIRSCLPLQFLPQPKTRNGTSSTLDSFVPPPSGEYDPATGEQR